jgi:hypothetical protein
LIEFYSISLVPAYPGLRRFPDGRDFKQWTGDDSKALMKVRSAMPLLWNRSEFFIIRYTSLQLPDMSHQTWLNASQHLWSFVTLYGATPLQAMLFMKSRTNSGNSTISATFLFKQAFVWIYPCHASTRLNTIPAPFVYLVLPMAYARQ